MGLMRFLVSDRSALPEDAPERIFMTGVEDVPWRSRCFWRDDQLVIERSVADSGNVHVPWRGATRPELTLATASLMERPRPYHLEVELARGTINSIRSQMAAWEMAGLVVSPEIREGLADSCKAFAKAATSQHQPQVAGEHAVAALRTAVQAGHRLGTSYTEQAINVRRRQTAQLSTLLGVNLGRLPIPRDLAGQLSSTFNTAVVPMRWSCIEEAEGQRDWTISDRQVQWCHQYGLKVSSGPLLQFDAMGIPDWAYLFEDDIDSLHDFMTDHVRNTVDRYRGRVHLWQVAGRISFGNELSLTEEQRLRMVVHAVDAVRSLDPRTPIVVSFDMPWAERLASEQLDLTPLHFADTLVRAEVGLSGLGLEINAGYWPGGTQHYGLLQYSRQLDRWSLLGLPLMVTLTCPSGPAAQAPIPRTARPIASDEHTLSPQWQADWVNDYVPLMLAKNCIQVVVWNQLQDRERTPFPHGGLFDTQNAAKPGLDALRQIRQEYLH